MAPILTATRVLAVAGAGYACTTAIVALGALLLSQAFGMARSEAVVLAAMSDIVLYLVILIWGFAEQRLARVWVLLLGGAAAGHGLVHWLTPLAAARITTSG